MRHLDGERIRETLGQVKLPLVGEHDPDCAPIPGVLRIGQHLVASVQDLDPGIAQEGGGIGQFLQFPLADHRPDQALSLASHSLGVGDQVILLLSLDIALHQAQDHGPDDPQGQQDQEHVAEHESPADGTEHGQESIRVCAFSRTDEG